MVFSLFKFTMFVAYSVLHADMIMLSLEVGASERLTVPQSLPRLAYLLQICRLLVRDEPSNPATFFV